MMKIIRIGFVIILGLSVFAGCGTLSKEKELSKKPMSMESQRQTVGVGIASVSRLTNISREAVKDKPGVTRVVLTLDKKASYSTSREGSHLIVNVFNAKMPSSLKELEVRDPVVKSIVAKQVGNSVKSIIDLVSADIAYTPSTSTTPFQILIDVWQIAPKTTLTQPSGQQAVSIVPAPVQSINTDDSSQRTKEVTLDVRETPDQSVTPESIEVRAVPPGNDIPAQLQWFSEKLSQVLQEKEQVKQELLGVETQFAVKDSMIQVLERKLKEANTRIVEIEEELIKAKSKMSLAEQNQFAVQAEVQQLLAQLEQAASGQVVPVPEGEEEEIKNRSQQILEKITVLQQESISLSEIKDQVDTLRAQIEKLIRERDGFRTQNESYAAEVEALQVKLGRLAGIETEVRTKDRELARLRKAIGTAAQLAMDTSTVPGMTTAPEVISQPLIRSETQSVGPAMETSQEMPDISEGSDTQLLLADLIQQAQLADQSAHPDDYILGPDDVVKIKVLNEENLDKTVTVSSDGFITYPLLGDLRVDGLSTAQLDAQISSLLARDFLVDPEVIVEVSKPRSKRVYIMGAVKQPGYQELPTDQRLLGTLLSAGGPVSFDTEARVLRLPKGDLVDEDTFSPIIIDLNKLFVGGDQSQNIILQDGDVLMVAAKAPMIGDMTVPSPGAMQFYVVGSVIKPGIYTYKEGDTVLDAVLRAGGFTEFASRNGTKVVRESDGKTRTMRVKMKDVMEKGEMDKNIQITPGDMIIVPESFF